ncbi:MAG TPA: hypothetical protein VJH89_02475, partial [Patescibacteria group bacterium]|nr:hypothetical protein [Patescibacteria group bacterium]
MNKTPLYRLEIAPLVLLPLGRSPLFSYVSDTSIARGSYVTIPFGKRALGGVVLDCAKLSGRAPLWMKPVGHILKKSFLTTEQLALAQYISEEYFTPLGKTLKHFLPSRTVTKVKQQPTQHQHKTLPRSTKKETLFLKTFSALTSPGYIDLSTLPHPEQYLIRLIQHVIAKNKQVLVLVPEVTLLPVWEATLTSYFAPRTIATLSSQVARGAYFEAWEKIRTGNIKIILATRQGLFAPFAALGAILLLEEQDESYKQWDMSPRYVSKHVAHFLATQHHAKYILASHTPSIDSMYALKEQRCTALTPITQTPPLAKNISIINLRLERFKKNYSPFSQDLTHAIRTTLGEGKQILLYIHRQGMSTFSVCEHCKNIFRCPRSGHALTHKDGIFSCLACKYKTTSFPNCPHCGHLSFRHIGYGTERIEREALKLFPHARIVRADGSTVRTRQHTQKLYDAILH